MRRTAGARPAAAAIRCASRSSIWPKSAPAAERSRGSTTLGVLRVGPLSAGADPGPACYGIGAAADGHRCQRRARAAQPASRWSAARFPIDAARSRAAVATRRGTARRRRRTHRGRDRRAGRRRDGARCCASSRSSAGSIRATSCLMAFGGGGPLHACALAGDLGMRRVIDPALSRVCSARSGCSPPTCARRSRVRSSRRSMRQRWRGARAVAAALSAEARAALRAQGVAEDAMRMRRRARRALRGSVVRSDRPVRRRRQRGRGGVPPAARTPLRLCRARRARRTRRGTRYRDRLAVGTVARGAHVAGKRRRRRQSRRRIGTRRAWDDGAFVDAAIYERERLACRVRRSTGPAIVEQYDTTTWIPPGWSATVDGAGNLLLERSVMTALDPITAEIIVSGLAVCERRDGDRACATPPTRRTSRSGWTTRARSSMRDCGLIAQAEHIPVHLGSLPWGLRRTLACIAARGDAMRPGDQWVVNDPVSVRDPPQRRHGHPADLRRRRDVRLRLQQGAPRRRRRDGAGLDAARRARALRRRLHRAAGAADARRSRS